ncbi:MAG: ParM/StbA family protein [Polaromonas sp.]|nr:ParM/StbA family protein [Polaromonas sp.]
MAAVKQEIIVGCDDGYAATDVVVLENGTIRRLKIPSRARSGIHGTSVIGGADGEAVPCYKTEGMQYTVGDLPDAETADFANYPVSAMNRVIIHHALRLAGLGGKNVRIATGLPLSTYYRGAVANDEFIQQKRQSLLSVPVEPMDASDTAKIVAHEVFPEGLAAWVDYAVDDKGQIRVDLEETVGVIDIGGRTTDIAVVLPGRRIDHARLGSVEIGALNLIDEVRVSLLQKHGFELPHGSIEKAISTGTIKVYGKALDVRSTVGPIMESVTKSILVAVDKILGKGMDIDKVLVVGGGAHIFKGVVKHFPNAVIPDEPEFANARGFAKFLSL